MNKLSMISLVMAVMADPRLLEGVVNVQESMSFLKRAQIKLEKQTKDIFGHLNAVFGPILGPVAGPVMANAFAAILIAGIMGVILGAVFLMVGMFLTATLNNAMPAVNDTNYTTTKNAVNSNINTAFTILGVALIFGGIGVIISSLMGWVGGGGGAI